MVNRVMLTLIRLLLQETGMTWVNTVCSSLSVLIFRVNLGYIGFYRTAILIQTLNCVKSPAQILSVLLSPERIKRHIYSQKEMIYLQKLLQTFYNFKLFCLSLSHDITSGSNTIF